MEQYPKIVEEKFTASGECIDVCPIATISMKNRKAFVEKSDCSNCRIGMRVYPEETFILK